MVTDLSHQEGSLQVNVDHLVKVLLLHPEQEPVLGDAGGVDDDVGGSLVFLQNFLETFTHRVRLGDIGGHTVMLIRSEVLRIEMIINHRKQRYVSTFSVCLQESMLRSATTTLALSRAKTWQTARPIPLPPPVTRASLPDRTIATLMISGAQFYNNLHSENLTML